VPSELACRFIIDASGQKALIAQQQGQRDIDPEFKFMSVWGYFKDSRYFALDGKAYDFEHLREIPPTTFVTATSRWGWSWHIPMRNNTSVGLVLPKQEVMAIKDSDEELEEYFLRKCGEMPYLRDLLENAEYEGNMRAIRDYSYRSQRFEGPGYFLTGDAAGFIDPIFSEGCLLAFYSAFLAAWAIERSFDDVKLEESSRRIYADQFSARYEVGHALALPRYQGNEAISEAAKSSIKFSSLLEQELMHVVSTVTTRNENFQDMIRDGNQRKVTSSKYRELDHLVV
jgi:flavin-dependent dehydrogenase